MAGAWKFEYLVKYTNPNGKREDTIGPFDEPRSDTNIWDIATAARDVSCREVVTSITKRCVVSNDVHRPSPTGTNTTTVESKGNTAT